MGHCGGLMEKMPISYDRFFESISKRIFLYHLTALQTISIEHGAIVDIIPFLVNWFMQYIYLFFYLVLFLFELEGITSGSIW